MNLNPITNLEWTLHMDRQSDEHIEDDIPECQADDY